MSYDILLQRIKERLNATGLSERAACIKAEVGLNTIRHIRARGHAPKIDNLRKLEAALGAPINYFVDVASEQSLLQYNANNEFPTMDNIYVKGAVQAGLWKESLEWPASDWIKISHPVDQRFLNIERFGLLVRGDSMDKIYPNGSIIVVVKFSDLGRHARNGERVVVLQRLDHSSEFEATIKRFSNDDGRVVLWPESSKPEFQQPIIIEPDNSCQSDTEFNNVSVFALVIGSYKIEY